MSEGEEETDRATAACIALVDGRDWQTSEQRAEIMVTLEHTIAVMLVTLYKDPRKAATMLNEYLVTGVEERLAIYNAGKEAQS